MRSLGKNSGSNILRIFSKDFKKPFFRNFFKKVRVKCGCQYDYRHFGSWMMGIGLCNNKYVKTRKLLQGVRRNPVNGRVLSIMLHTFMEKFARCMMLTSKKMASHNIFASLCRIRSLLNNISKVVVSSMGTQ